MTTMAWTASRSAVDSARAWLDHALATERCHDAWRASAGSPPLERTPSVFLMYFVARALAASGGIGAHAASSIRSVLATAQKGVAYGYAACAPADADDTAFALRTRLLLGDHVDRRAVDECLAPFARGGSWLTFDRPLGPSEGWAVECRDDADTTGFHPEVHLNVLCLLREVGGDSRVPSDLPRSAGLYPSYHYPSRLYATWLAAELENDRRSLRDPIDRAVLAAQRAEGTWAPMERGFSAAQETALAILSLSTEGLASEAGRCARAGLQALQCADGSWPGGVLWIYWVPGRGGRLTWWAEDVMRIVSTSLAIMALQRGVEPR
jgi:hypothetical protein